MSKSKEEFMRLLEEQMHEEKIDLEAMLRSMMFLPTMTGNAQFVDYLKKLNTHETGSIQSDYQEGNEQNEGSQE